MEQKHNTQFTHSNQNINNDQLILLRSVYKEIFAFVLRGILQKILYLIIANEKDSYYVLPTRGIKTYEIFRTSVIFIRLKLEAYRFRLNEKICGFFHVHK